MAKFRFRIRWLILGLLALFYLPLIPGCIMVHAPKSGRIVDEATGKGIPNAFVIAAGVMICSGSGFIEAHTSAESEYRVVVHTDDDGNYWLPNKWLHLTFDHFYPFFGSCNEKWKLTAFKPGYVVSDDERIWAAVPPNARNGAHFKPRFNHPSSYWLGLFVKVEPLLMHEKKMDVGDASKYYSDLIELTGSPPIKPERTTDELALRDASAAFFLPKVCALDPEEVIDLGPHMAAFINDSDKYVDIWNSLDHGVNYGKGGKQEYPSKAKYVCEAMKLAVE